jgi:hypothetical protein
LMVTASRNKSFKTQEVLKKLESFIDELYTHTFLSFGKPGGLPNLS